MRRLAFENQALPSVTAQLSAIRFRFKIPLFADIERRLEPGSCILSFANRRFNRRCDRDMTNIELMAHLYRYSLHFGSRKGYVNVHIRAAKHEKEAMRLAREIATIPNIMNMIGLARHMEGTPECSRGYTGQILNKMLFHLNKDQYATVATMAEKLATLHDKTGKTGAPLSGAWKKSLWFMKIAACAYFCILTQRDGNSLKKPYREFLKKSMNCFAWIASETMDKPVEAIAYLQ